jgi:DNA-binding CsgD family transcriptional regulator
MCDDEHFADDFHDAVLEGHWQQAAFLLSRFLGRSHVVLGRHGVKGDMQLRSQTGFTKQDFEFIREHHEAGARAYALSLREEADHRTRSCEAAWSDDSSALSLAALIRQRWGKTPDFGAVLCLDEEGVELVSIMRSLDQKNVDERSRFQSILPHLRRSFRAARILERHAVLVGGFETAFDAMSVGLFLCRGDGSLLHMNAFGQSIAERGDGLRVSRTGLRLSDRSADARLLEEVKRAAEGAPGRARPILVPRTLGARPLTVTVIGQQRGVATVFIEDPDREMQPEIERLRLLTGLSEAQAKVARLAASGEELSSIARCLGVSENTARTHLRRAFTKLDVTNRRELALRLAAFQGMLR